MRLVLVALLAWAASPLVSRPALRRGKTARGAAPALDDAFEDAFDDMFHGDFDNWDQVQNERAAGIEKAQGHEHIHCALRRIPHDRTAAIVGEREAAAADSVMLACYYLDADPSRVFRLRAYALERLGDGAREMRLYRPPLRALDAAHASAAELPTRGVAAATTKMAAMDCGAWELLDGCDVTWRPSGSGFRGTMRAGGCVITSQYNASRSMLIKDDLGLSAEALCVDDRGYDGATGAQIYGSKEGVPYRMERVLVPSPLEWTLGEAFKLADGPSAR